MKYLLTFLTLMIAFIANSQETEKYNSFTEQLNLIKSETRETKYKNGQIKEVKTYTTYEFKGEEYILLSGPFILYSKKGVKIFERISNMFGSVLSMIFYDNNGNLLEYSKTIELDTNVDSVEEFLTSKYPESIITETELYFVKKNKSVLVQKGIEINRKKSGVWNLYKDGKFYKTKKYKERNKFDNLLPAKYK